MMKEAGKNPYETYNVPGLGKKLNDGTYWTFINESEVGDIKANGMKCTNLATGRQNTCLEIRQIGDKFIGRWR